MRQRKGIYIEMSAVRRTEKIMRVSSDEEIERFRNYFGSGHDLVIYWICTVLRGWGLIADVCLG